MKLKHIGMILILFSTLTTAFGQIDENQLFRGEVKDSEGFSVSGAEIKVRSADKVSTCRTNNQGYFKCEFRNADRIEITIRANGYSILRQTVANIQDAEVIPVFVLTAGFIREEVVVDVLKSSTAVDEAPASIRSLSKEAIETSAATGVDGALRQTVGFSLFRRTESSVANPTTQGASLRAVNSSGASRSKVLEDGIPVNDPFGGWIVWGRIPKASLNRIDILRGGGSSLYGSGAIGGTVNLLPRTASSDGFQYSIEVSGGSSKTFDGSGFFGYQKNRWTADLFTSVFQTKGYRIVEKSVRGPVDDFANSHNTNGSIRLARSFGDFSHVFAKSSVFGEARNNGTPVQKNRTHFRFFAVGADLGLDANGNTHLLFTAFGSTQVFDQKFSAVNTDRDSENLVRFQRVPAQRTGFTARFATLIRNNGINIGVDFTEVRGSSNETGFFGGSATSLLGTGGRERDFSVFGQDFLRIGNRLSITGSIRYERRRNFSSLRTLRSLSMNTVSTEFFDNRTQDAWSPAAAAIFGISDNFSVYGSVGRSFRAPTLNELFRGFRVGSVITNPNELLTAERSKDIEGGFKFSQNRIYFQASVFRTTVSDAVSNVTINSGPPLTIRERQNAGQTKSQGLETEVEYRTAQFELGAGYLFANAEVTEFESNPVLVGLRIPQVPRHQITFHTNYRFANNWFISFQGRGSSSQFDDDLNSLKLEKYFRGDLYVSGKVSEKVSVFGVIENVFNSRYTVGRTPVRTIGPPISFRVGVRIN